MPKLNPNSTTDAWRYPQYATNGAHETFEPENSAPQDWWGESAAVPPRSSMTTTTVEQLEQQARAQAQQESPNRLSEFRLVDVGSEASDADVMDFYAGRNYSEGG